MAVSCETVWSHSRCPPATTALTRSGYAWACVPTMQNVAFTPLSFSSRSTWGVQVGSGPSSMVMLTPRAPRSEACAMSSATLVTFRSWCRASGVETPASGCRPPAVSACAVQTEVAAAIAVTPSAAARSLLCQPLPLCFAMSARPFAVSADAVHPSSHTNVSARKSCYRSRTNPQGTGDNWRSSATEEGRDGPAETSARAAPASGEEPASKLTGSCEGPGLTCHQVRSSVCRRRSPCAVRRRTSSPRWAPGSALGSGRCPGRGGRGSGCSCSSVPGPAPRTGRP